MIGSEPLWLVIKFLGVVYNNLLMNKIQTWSILGQALRVTKKRHFPQNISRMGQYEVVYPDMVSLVSKDLSIFNGKPPKITLTLRARRH